jgi:hypothetical protein
MTELQPSQAAPCSYGQMCRPCCTTALYCTDWLCVLSCVACPSEPRPQLIVQLWRLCVPCHEIDSLPLCMLDSSCGACHVCNESWLWRHR